VRYTSRFACSCRRLGQLSFVFELRSRAFLRGDVIAGAEIDRLIDAARFRERVEIAAFDAGAGDGDFVIGRNSYVARGLDPFTVEEQQPDAALRVDLADDERGRLDELVFELRTARGWTPGEVGRIGVLEDDAFRIGRLQPVEHLALLLGQKRRLDEMQVRCWNEASRFIRRR